jgi:hypothetical protein
VPSLVGFTLYRGLTPERVWAGLEAQRRALRPFPHLRSASLPAGDSRLEIWGHPELDERVHIRPDGTLSAFIGIPHGEVNWQESVSHLFGHDAVEKLEIPWDGRTILLQISEGGTCWTLCNDWIGSIPVYHARIGNGWIASTLEPVVVAAAAFSPEDISLPAMIWQLVNGHFFSDWTMFRGMKAVPADCIATWRGSEFHWRRLWTVVPSCDRWETAWEDLLDEMYQLSREAIGHVLKIRPFWILPLSSGLDSRLIAAVGAEMGVDLRAYTWGGRDATDVMFGRRIAKRLKIPWQFVDLGKEYLVTQVVPWTGLFGSSMHLHGMYQLEFFKQLQRAPEGPAVSGYLGDVLSGNGNAMLVAVHSAPNSAQLYDDGYAHWTVDEVKAMFKPPLDEALAEIREELRNMWEGLPGALFQKATLLDLWTRQCRFTNFHTTLADYQRGVATPYMSRSYARFCLSLPRVASDRQLLADMYRRYYPRLAAVPGSYAAEPYLLTGRYLLKRRLARKLPLRLRRGPFAGTRFVPLTMDLECVQAHGWKSLWPIREAWESLSSWVNLDHVTRTFDEIMAGSNDLRMVKKLQSIQCLAYRLLRED